jgi:hypothetical protein
LGAAGQNASRNDDNADRRYASHESREMYSRSSPNAPPIVRYFAQLLRSQG